MNFLAVLKTLKSKVSYHSETIIGIPCAVLGLLLISEAVGWFTGRSITEDVDSVAKYAIQAVGFLIAAGISIAVKSRSIGDIDQNSVDFKTYLCDTLASCFFLILALIAVFGSSLWH